ncbi:MAG: DUF5054 domain-containing protein [Faecousia sp.]
MKEVIILFKTHLDLGFTDLAETVYRRYMTEYIPAALALAKQTRGTQERFVWTVGSWLFQQYRAFAGDSPELEEAVRCGDIRWHGLPFTTHTEYMTPELFSYGLSLSQELDKRYGTRTVAAKMTDVPGHTRAVIPLLANAGIRLLHIGVNPASKVPEVPTLFWWEAPGGQRILTMYNGDYGELTPVGSSGTAVYFAHTGDNHGPQGVEQIRQIYETLRQRFPGAVLRAGTLEDVAAVALQQDGLPVVTGEIGDTWIHGTGTDPAKTSAYRGLLRLAKELPEEKRERVYAQLLPVPEHTWGLDEKTHLSKTYFVDFKGEYGFFAREEFEKARSSERFRLMERSWQEQRQYVRNGCDAFPEEIRPRAEAVLAQVRRLPGETAGAEAVLPEQLLRIGQFGVAVDDTGAVCRLEWDGRTWADEAHPLCRFLYEAFSEKEFDRFRQQYVRSDESWAIEDFGKIGMEKANDRYRGYSMTLTGLWRRGDTLMVKGRTQPEAFERFGCPEEFELLLSFREGEIHGDFAWFRKPANRIAEALWLGFCPKAKLRAVHKLGAWIDPMDVVDGGNKRMHVTQDGVRWEGLSLQGVDTGLISVGGPSLLYFSNEAPSLEKGVWFNLYNNVWGTNFPMWYDQDSRFRFVLSFEKTK